MVRLHRPTRLLCSLIVTASWLRAAALHAPVHRVVVASHRPARSCLSPRTVVMMQEELAIGTDLFAIVGVSPDAAPADIKKAFHRKARKLHPDMNPEPDAAVEFRRLVAAFETLSDPEKRREWDLMQSGQGGRAAQRSTGSPGTSRAPGARGRYTDAPGSGYRSDGSGTSSQAWKTTGQMPFAARGAYRPAQSGPAAGPPTPPRPAPTPAQPTQSGGQQQSGGPCTMPPRRSCPSAAAAADPFIVVPPGSLRTWSNPAANWARVQVMLGTSDGMALDADLELWHGGTAHSNPTL